MESNGLNFINNITWFVKSFDKLSPFDVYQIIDLRNKIFKLEQNCDYNDIDSLDYNALHVFSKDDNEIFAYARIIPPGIKSENLSFGRLLLSKEYRGSGIGKILVSEVIKIAKENFPNNNIEIAAQSYLENFYKDFGFTTSSDEYILAGIKHINMILKN